MERAVFLAWRTVDNILDGIWSHLPNIIIGIIVYSLFVKASGILRKIIIRIGERAKLDNTLDSALGTLSATGLHVLGILITAVIVVPDFKLSNVVAGLGIGSIAVGFAFKDILENFLAGIVLLWQKPFVLGDVIRTGMFEGTVEEMRIRSTRLKTEDGELVVIPNSQIFANPILVRTANKTRRSDITITGNPNISVEDNRRIIKQILDSTETIAKYPLPEILLTDIGSGNQIFTVRFWTDAAQNTIARTIDQVNSRIRDAMYQSAHHS